jgi:hypothetical protein
MAEQTYFHTLRGATLKFKDGGGTPKEYTIRLTSGQAAITAGGYTIVRMKDAAGDFIGPARKGEVANPSTVSISAAMFDPGANASEAVLMDIMNGTGYFASTWTSTDTDSDLETFDFTLALADSGTNKGAVYALNDCVVQPGYSMNPARDGIMLTFTVESPNAVIGITRNT